MSCIAKAVSVAKMQRTTPLLLVVKWSVRYEAEIVLRRNCSVHSSGFYAAPSSSPLFLCYQEVCSVRSCKLATKAGPELVSLNGTIAHRRHSPTFCEGPNSHHLTAFLSHIHTCPHTHRLYMYFRFIRSLLDSTAAATLRQRWSKRATAGRTAKLANRQSGAIPWL